MHSPISNGAALVLMFLIFLAQFAVMYFAVHLPIGQDNVIADVVIALLAADFGAALFHWFEDAYLDYNNNIPIVSNVAKANEMHHYRPRVIVHESYISNIVEISIISIIYALIILWLGHVRATPVPIRRLLLVLVFASLTNLIHRYSHEKDCERPTVVTWLQKWLLISRDEHRVHHSSEEHRKFGVVLKHTNYIYDSIGLWRALERILKIFGIHPSHKSYYVPDYDNDVILNDETNCQKHSNHDVQEWKKKLQEYHELRN